MVRRIVALFCTTLIFGIWHAPIQAQSEGSSQERNQNQATSPAQSGQSQAARAPNVYPTLAAELVERGAPVIDVRSEAEIEETGVLANAAHIPHTEIDAIAELIGDNTSRATVLYCGSGRRVGLVIEALRARGYHGLVNAGGFENLRAALQAENEG